MHATNAEALASLPTTIVEHKVPDDQRRCPSCGEEDTQYHQDEEACTKAERAFDAAQEALTVVLDGWEKAVHDEVATLTAALQPQEPA